MNTHVNKTQVNKSQSVVNASSQKQHCDESMFQFIDNRPETLAQRKLQEIANNSTQTKHTFQLQAMVDTYSAQQQIQRKENNTGLPDNLKAGIENLSGYLMDDVKVHYNSSKPAQLNAYAYAQGTDIHLGSGQEKHLPHEAWHVAQQKQGRVKPTMKMKGRVNINDDTSLEKEADTMGAKALDFSSVSLKGLHKSINQNSNEQPIQAVWIQDGPDSFVWHTTRDGVEWHYNENEDTMFYIIQKLPKNLSKKATKFYIKFNKQPLPYEDWIKIMTSELGELVDEDDPVYENPEFLIGEGSLDKIMVLQQMSTVLKSAGIQVFLGGAASGALITKTRRIKDLDLRMDGQARDIFNENKYPNFFKDHILAPLTQAGFKVSDIEKAANTTMRFYINKIEISITSEPSHEKTMTRGKMVTDVESLGEIDFILDKAAAAGDRKSMDKLVTDVFDIIRVTKAMPGGIIVLHFLASMRPKSGKKIKGLVSKLKQIVNNSKGRQYKDPNIGKACESLCVLLKIEKQALGEFLTPIITALNSQEENVMVI